MSTAAPTPSRILLVEDHEEMRASIRETLAGLPFEIVECADGEKAVEQSREVHPTWILMDIGLPGLDGLAATRAIREHSPTVNVVIVTAFDSPAFRAAAARAGAAAYVLKSELQRIPQIVTQPSGNPHSAADRDANPRNP